MLKNNICIKRKIKTAGTRPAVYVMNSLLNFRKEKDKVPGIRLMNEPPQMEIHRC